MALALFVAYGLLLGCPLALASSQSAMYFVHSDHLGAPWQLTDEAATVVWQADYEPFGKISLQRTTTSHNVRFPGQYYDAESGLHYNYFRDYDPATGRYIQSDPLGLRGNINTYAYTRSNPIRRIDRLGLEDVSVDPSFGTTGDFMQGSVQASVALGTFLFTANSEFGPSSQALLLPEIGASLGICMTPSENCPTDRSTPETSRPPVDLIFFLKNMGVTVLASGGVCLNVGPAAPATPFTSPINIAGATPLPPQPSPDEALFVGS